MESDGESFEISHRMGPSVELLFDETMGLSQVTETLDEDAQVLLTRSNDADYVISEQLTESKRAAI